METHHFIAADHRSHLFGHGFHGKYIKAGPSRTMEDDGRNLAKSPLKASISLELVNQVLGGTLISFTNYPLEISHGYGKSPFFMGKSTISTAIFNSFLLVYQRVNVSHI